MKKLSIWKMMILTLLIGFSSCEEIEELENCPDVSIEVDHETGSAVYRFVAQLDGIEDVSFVWSIDGETIDSGTIGDIKDQILDFRFEPGLHTVCVKLAREDCPIEVCTEIDVEIDQNDPCPDLFFETRELDGPSQYKFIPDFEGMNEVAFGWTINGEPVGDWTAGADNYLIWSFEEAGSYEVCMVTETPECPQGVTYCKVIEIEQDEVRCPEISFVKELVPGTVGTYNFEATISEIDNATEMLWFVNGELAQSSDDFFTYQFENGVHEVCFQVITESCPNGVRYCKEVVVEQASACPDLLFEAEQDGNSYAYYFYPAAFEGMDDTQLEWFINGNYVGSSPDNPHNNPFYWQLDGPGEYEVCLMIETPDCPEGTSFCKVIVVEDNNATCPELFFAYEQEGTTPGYNFYADFEGMNDISYVWIINGDVVDSENIGTNERDNYLYYQFGAGTYEICIQSQMADCPNGLVQYCKTLVVD